MSASALLVTLTLAVAQGPGRSDPNPFGQPLAPVRGAAPVPPPASCKNPGPDDRRVDYCGDDRARTGTSGDQDFLLPPAEFLERNYFFWSLPPISPNPTPHTWWLRFEAQVALHLFFFNNIGRVADRRGHWAGAFALDFVHRVRMLNRDSDPVRTPSYLPRITGQLARFYYPRTGSFYEVGELLFDVQVGHHSNGQEYCPFAAGVRDGQCPPFATDSPRYELVNLENGNFSTNYLRVGAHHRFILDLDENHVVHRSFALGARYERASSVGPGGIDAPHDQLYGRNRLELDGELQVLDSHLLPGLGWWPGLIGHHRAELSYEWVQGTGPGIARHNISAELSRSFLQAGGLGAFLRLYRGQDYYNINYVHRIDYQFHFGIMLELAPPLRFRGK